MSINSIQLLEWFDAVVVSGTVPGALPGYYGIRRLLTGELARVDYLPRQRFFLRFGRTPSELHSLPPIPR